MFDTMRWSEPSTPHDDSGPPTIKNHSVTFFNGYLYCFGGYDGRRNHMTLLLYSLVDQVWIPTKTLVNNNYHNNHHHHHQQQQHHQTTSNMPAASNTGARNAIPVDGLPPPGRNGHTATLAKDDDDEGSARIIIIGGWLGSGPLAASDVHVLELHHGENNSTQNSNNQSHNNINHNSSRTPSLRWYQPPMMGLPPGPCNMHSADFVAKRREVYVFRGGNGREYLNDLHALHVDTYQWRKVETTGEIPQQRANHSSALLEETGELFVFGGWNGRERLNDIHILDTETSTWTRPDVGGVLPHPRAGMTLTALRGRLFLFGGSGTSSKCFQDLQILDRKEMAWLDVEQSEGRNASNRPVNYNNGDHADFDSLVATGGGGGGGGSSGGNAIGLTDWRSRDSTTLMSTSSSLSAMMMPNMTTPNPNDEESVPTIVVQGEGPGRRAGHTATAVNRRLYVFGGSCGSDYLNDFFVLDTDPPPRAVVTEPASVQLMERRLRHFWNDEEFSDVTFVVEGRRIFGHKLILSIVSDCFRAMFTTGFRESEANAEIEIHNSPYEAFMAMMEYIYTGRISQNLVEMHAICDLLELADQFFLDHLKQRCEMLLQSEVNVDTVEYLQQVAQKTNATQLLKICAHFQRNEANRI